jgi:D-3-phosphoglycerate dehydrogenase
MAKILITNSLSPSIITALQSDGNSVDVNPSLTSAALPLAIGSAEILVVRSTRVTREAIASASNLALIVRAGAGVDTIDLAVASSSGVLVCNTPGCNSDAVAELAIGHLIACDRQIVNNSESLRCGEWAKSRFLACNGLHSRTLCVVGAGAIAQRVMRVAQAIGMKVVCCAPELDDALALRLGVAKATDKFELARISDAISVHIPFLSDTFHYCSNEFFEAMKAGAIFINTSRGEVVDMEAMIAAIKVKEIKVGLDVYEEEPNGGTGEFQQKELAHLMCSGTCHIGGSTMQASEAVGEETLNVLRTFIKTGKALHCINLPAQRPAIGEEPKTVKNVLEGAMLSLSCT